MSKHQDKSFKKRNLTKFFSQPRYFWLFLATIFLLLGIPRAVAAQDGFDSNALKTIWMLIAASLVFFMNAGFALLEAGFCTRKNAVNVLAKNLIVFCVSALAYWLIGFTLMFGDSSNNILGGLDGFLFNIPFTRPGDLQPFPPGFDNLKQEWAGRSFAAQFFFQLAFAGTAATIVSGAVAERIRFLAFVFFSFFLVGIIYPIVGHLVWASDGLLKNELINFHDFAGSTVVHSVGGMAAWIGAKMLGPRRGWQGYNPDAEPGEEFRGEKREFPANELTFSTLGCLILWLGWFGFNGGSAAELENLPHIIATTMIAAASGGVAVLFLSGLTKKPSLGSVINGILGGLVGITASSAYVSIFSAFVIGTISAFFVLLGEYILKQSNNSLQTDDPVGAVPVHLFCGFWGTIAVGIFSSKVSPEYEYIHTSWIQSLLQLGGWILCVSIVCILSWLAWLIIGIFLYYMNPKHIKEFPTRFLQDFDIFKIITEHHKIGRIGIRVSEENEKKGSDDFFYKT